MTDKPRFTITSSTTLAEYSFLRVDLRTVQGPDGSEADRYVVVHPGAVAVVPIVGDDVLMIEQYRTPVDAWVLEIPAGKLDADDTDPVRAAHRELSEEVGMSAGSLTELGSVQTGVGFTDEEITIFLAEDMKAGDVNPDGPEEAAAVMRRVPFDDAISMVIDGRIKDAKTITGLMLAQAHRNGADLQDGTA